MEVCAGAAVVDDGAGAAELAAATCGFTPNIESSGSAAAAGLSPFAGAGAGAAVGAGAAAAVVGAAALSVALGAGVLVDIISLFLTRNDHSVFWNKKPKKRKNFRVTWQ